MQGGIAVPEGARVFADNVSFRNTVSEEVTDNDKWAYLKVFEQVDVPDVRDQALAFPGMVGLNAIICTQRGWHNSPRTGPH